MKKNKFFRQVNFTVFKYEMLSMLLLLLLSILFYYHQKYKIASEYKDGNDFQLEKLIRPTNVSCSAECWSNCVG